MRKKWIAEHKQKIDQYKMYKGLVQGLGKKIQFAVDNQYLQVLKQPLYGYKQVTPCQMLQHFEDNCTIGTTDIDELEKNTQ